MRITTPDDITIYCLPDCAKCKAAGKSPEELVECPNHTFDLFGDKCIPELCEEYTEDE